MIGWLRRVWRWFFPPKFTVGGDALHFDTIRGEPKKESPAPVPEPKRQARVEAGYGPKRKCYVCGEEHRRWARKGPFGGIGPIMFKLPYNLWICRRCKVQSKVVGEFRSSVKKEARRIREQG